MGRRAEPTTAEQACFEIGIKFGSLYHQFAGTPVSPESASSLAAGMEEAIENQPYCESVTVKIDTTALEEELATRSVDYTELTGRFLDVSITVALGECTVRATMQLEGDYPRMAIESIEEPQ